MKKYIILDLSKCEQTRLAAVYCIYWCSQCVGVPAGGSF